MPLEKFKSHDITCQNIFAHEFVDLLSLSNISKVTLTKWCLAIVNESHYNHDGKPRFVSAHQFYESFCLSRMPPARKT